MARTAIVVFVLSFALTAILGFVAANWRLGNLTELDEWGLMGRLLGAVVTWFLLGGDAHTACAFIGAGAIGFFALPHMIIVYLLVPLTLLRMWAVTHKHNYITVADFGHYGNRWLATAVGSRHVNVSSEMVSVWQQSQSG